MEKNMINLTGLWINESKNGDTYLAGNIGAAKLMVFKNNRKQEGSKQPDYYVTLAPYEPKEKKDAPASDIPF